MTETILDVWPPLPPAVWLRRPAALLPFPLREPGCVLFARARHALWHAVAALGLVPGDEVLVPAYHHGSEIEALVRRGLVPRFYGGDERLEPLEDELASLTGERTRALYVVHTLGFPQEGARWRRWCDARGLLLIEDAAQAWLATRDGTPVGSHGDAAIFCVYKTVGVPDGGALLVAAPPPVPDTAETLGAAGVARRHAAWAAARAPLVARAVERRPPRPYDAATDFDLGDPSSPAAPLTRALLPRLVGVDVAAARRERYARLLERLGSRVPAPFETLPGGASPFACPVEVDRKAEALARLRDRGIRALDLWSVPHPLLHPGDFPAVARRRAHVIGLPVHQELGAADLQRVAASL